ncbi:MAG: hypothetical protein ACOX3K_05020 [Bacilli bacterium]
MDKNKLITDFCDNTYATKQEVVKATQTTMIEPFWRQIIEYRSGFTRPLGLKTVTNDPFRVVLTPVISEKLNQLERKLLRASLRVEKLNSEDLTAVFLRDKQYQVCLSAISTRYQLQPNPSFLHSVVRGNVSAPAVETMVIVNYFSALKYIEHNKNKPLDEDFIGYLYTIMNSGAELTQFYRTKEVRDPSQQSLIDQVYLAAPVSRIDDMMKSLFAYLNNDHQTVLVRALFAFFFFSYVKPFEFYSEELAILLLKTILIKHDLEPIATLLDLEKLLIEDHERLEMLNYEVKRTTDFTYLLFDFIPRVSKAVDDLMERLINLEKDVLIKENYQVETPEPEREIAALERASTPPHHLPPPLTPPPVIEERRLEAELSAFPPLTEAKPVIETKTPEVVEEKPAPALVEQKLAGGEIAYEQRLAVDSLPIGLDEVDAAKLEIHLREMDPSLKKGEAYFYARHCTLGKFYTIDQYRKTLNCAYETARTSMEHLVEAGYYRKEKYKNKFIYTPVPRRR